jgi:hypothetical protein
MPTPVFMSALAHIKHFLPKSLRCQCDGFEIWRLCGGSGSRLSPGMTNVILWELITSHLIECVKLHLMAAKAGMTVLRKNTTIKT